MNEYLASATLLLCHTVELLNLISVFSQEGMFLSFGVINFDQ